MIHILQEEIFSRISEIIDWSLIKLESLVLHKENIHIVPCNDGYIPTVQAFKHSSSEKVTEFSYKTDEIIKSLTGGCSHCYPGFRVILVAILVLWSNGLVIKALDSQAKVQGRLSLSSFRGW